MLGLNQPLNKTLLRIEELCGHYQWNHYRLAKSSGIPLASVNAMFHRNTSPTIPTLEKICDGFQISMKEFFDYEILPNIPELSSDARILVERYERLSGPDKKLLIAYLDGLQKINYANKKEQE